MPGDFLDVIVDSEYESPVTDWVIRRACLDTAARSGGPRKVTVNLSSLQVGRSDLPQVVNRCLAESGLAAADLVLELTEDRLLSRPDGAELLERLHDSGVELAIDDFGTGYAGLLYLQRFQSINVVKLDRSFTAGLGPRPGQRAHHPLDGRADRGAAAGSSSPRASRPAPRPTSCASSASSSPRATTSADRRLVHLVRRT